MTEDDFQKKLEILRAEDDNTFLIVANALKKLADECEESGVSAYNFFKDKKEYEHSLPYYKKILEQHRNAAVVLREISKQLMDFQKEQWKPINELIAKYYKEKK